MANKEKQIDEMARDLENHTCMSQFQAEIASKMLYAKGYRKASEVVLELISEIDNSLHDIAMEYHTAGHPEYFAVCEMVHYKVIAPIEKKYTESEDTE